MKKKRYTIQLIPDNEEAPRVFSLSLRTFRLIFLLVMLLLISLGGALYWMIPRVLDYRNLKAENEYLIGEHLKATRIIKDYNRIKQMDQYIRERLGVDLGLPSEYSGNDTSIQENAQSNNIPVASLENLPTYPPVSGFITQHFHVDSHGKGSNHYGVDIASKSGEPIFAAADGLVVFSGWTYRYGYTVILSHGDRFFTVYAHNLRNTVEMHEYVKRGELIGYLGNSGLSYGPHLHFEVWKDGIPIDPVLYVHGYKSRDVSIDAGSSENIISRKD